MQTCCRYKKWTLAAIAAAASTQVRTDRHAAEQGEPSNELLRSLGPETPQQSPLWDNLHQLTADYSNLHKLRPSIIALCRPRCRTCNC